jgi:hypothetical protein
MACTETAVDFSPEATRNLPCGSMAKPRGCFSVGVAPSQVRRPSPSARYAQSVLLVRSEV